MLYFYNSILYIDYRITKVFLLLKEDYIMKSKDEIVEVFIKEKEVLNEIDVEAAYPGNIKKNIAFYTLLNDRYELGLEKRVFLNLIYLYKHVHNIDDAYCIVCGKLCNVKGKGFHSTCSKECGMIVSRAKYKENYHNKTDNEKQQIKDKRKQTNLERYGVTTNLNAVETLEKRKEKFNGSISPFNLKEVRENIAINNAQKHDGLTNSFQWEETKEKISETNMQRYGVHNPAQYKPIMDKIKDTQEKLYDGMGFKSKVTNDKIKETNLLRYGTKIPQRTEEIKEKTRKTCLKNLGVEAPLKNQEIRKKAMKSCIAKYGVAWNCESQNCRKAAKVISNVNLMWKEEIEKLGYTVEMEKVLDNKSFDLYLPEKNLLIEINPTISHQSTREVAIGTGKIRPKSKLYHKEKHKIAIDNGYQCLMVWEWDSLLKILNYLKPKREVKLKNTYIAKIEPTVANNFLSKYHLQGMCNGNIINYGLFEKDTNELLSVMTFGKSRYTKKYEYEWLRYASNAIIHRAASTMFNKFIEEYNPNSIVSYCDRSKFDGKMFSHLGFILKEEPQPSLHYHNPNKNLHYTFNLVNKLGACRVLNIEDISYDTGISNRDIMVDIFKFYEVYDCGQAVYTWHKKEE